MDLNQSEVQRLRTWVIGSFVLWVCTVGGFAWALYKISTQSVDVLRTRELVIVDQRGTTRVRIAAPLPEPVAMGKQGKRDDTVAGVMLYDALGNERGGYVTDNSVGNAFLTLDSNAGQEVTLVAYPNGGAEFGL